MSERDSLDLAKLPFVTRTWDRWKTEGWVLYWRKDKPTLYQAIRFARGRPERRMLTTIYRAGLHDPKEAERWLRLALPEKYGHFLKLGVKGKVDHTHEHELKKDVDKALAGADPLEVRKHFLALTNGKGNGKRKDVSSGDE